MFKLALVGNEIPFYFPAILADALYAHAIPCHIVICQENPITSDLLYHYGIHLAKNGKDHVHISTASTIEKALDKADGIVYAHDAQSTSRYHEDVESLSQRDPEMRFLGNRSPYIGICGLLQNLRQGSQARPLCQAIKQWAPSSKTTILSSNATTLVSLFSSYGLEAVGFSSNDTNENQKAFQTLLKKEENQEGKEKNVFFCNGMEHFLWLTSVESNGKTIPLDHIKEKIIRTSPQSTISKWIDLYDGVACSDVQQIGQFMPPQPDIHPFDEMIFSETIQQRKERILHMNKIADMNTDVKEKEIAQIALLSNVSAFRPVKTLYQLYGLLDQPTPIKNLLVVNDQKQISNLPVNAIVVNTLSPSFHYEPLPQEVAFLGQNIVLWQSFVIKSMEGDWSSVRQAIENDPSLENGDKLAGYEMSIELINRHADLLEQFV
ncbi:MAG: hypothetical protein GX786_08435 [Clostridiales bacterium]|nr:hypothetical protein [Clostridiales bacterium]